MQAAEEHLRTMERRALAAETAAAALTAELNEMKTVRTATDLDGGSSWPGRRNLAPRCPSAALSRAGPERGDRRRAQHNCQVSTRRIGG